MKFYTVNPIAAAIFFCALMILAIGLLVVMPITFIQWIWNSLIVTSMPLPQISMWQAGLLYLAFAALLYISGFVRIEIHADEH